MESELVAVERAYAVAMLKSAFSQGIDNGQANELECISDSQDDTKSGLMNLSQDSIPWFAKAIASFSLSEEFTEQALAKFDATPGADCTASQCGFQARVRVEIYDNTIAVATANCVLDAEMLPSTWDPDDFEMFLSKIGAAIVAPINNSILMPVLRSLHAESKKRRARRSILRPERAFQIFSDLNDHPFPAWDDDVSPSFWTHRVYAPTSDQRAEPTLRKLMRVDEIEQYGEKLKDGTVLYVGSSLAADPDQVPSLARALSLSQFFYCLLDVLNANQNKIYRRLASVKRRRETIQIFSKFNRMENFIDYVYNEIVDTELSLQNSRRMFFSGFGRVFGTGELVSVLRGREKLVSDRVKRKRHEIERNNRRTIQFTLFLLGATQIMTLFVELFDYVGRSPTSEVAGLADLFRWMDFNTTFHVMSVLVIFGALYATFRRQ